MERTGQRRAVESDHALRRQHARKRTDRGGLSRAVGAEQRDDFSGPDTDVDVGDHGQVAVTDAKVAGFEQVGHVVPFGARPIST
jgi:hypothetical protein